MLAASSSIAIVHSVSISSVNPRVLKKHDAGEKSDCSGHQRSDQQSGKRFVPSQMTGQDRHGVSDPMPEESRVSQRHDACEAEGEIRATITQRETGS